MDKVISIIFECMIAVSVILCFVYIALTFKKARENGNKPSGAVLSKRNVELSYDGEKSPAVLTFYTDGLLFEKDGGNTLFISEKKIVHITKLENSSYNVEFMPSAVQSDKFNVYSEQNIEEDIMNVVVSSKLTL